MHNGTSSHLEHNLEDVPELTKGPHETNGVIPNGSHEPDGNTSPIHATNFEHNQHHLATTPSSPTRGRKRKLSDTRSPKPKKESPPWKKFSAEGPTFFKTEDGKRKSARQNAVPLELQPPGSKRQTRGEYSKHSDDRNGAPPSRDERIRPRGGKHSSGQRRVHLKTVTSSIDPTSANNASAPRSKNPRASLKDEHERSSISHREPQHLSTSQRSLRRHRSSIENTHATAKSSPNAARRDNRLRNKPLLTESPRIMLRLGPRALPILNPSNIPPVRKLASLGDWLQYDDPLEGEDDRRPTEEEATQEAKARLRLLNASRPGGALSKDSIVLEESPEDEPFAGYAHLDHLVLHVLDLRQRMQREAREHRATAKRLAYAAAAAVRAKMPKTAEELEAEARTRISERMRNVLGQLRSHLDLASQKIMELKKQDYFDREAAVGRERMKVLVDRSEGLLTARTAHLTDTPDEGEGEGERPAESSVPSDEEDDGSSESTDNGSGDDDEDSEGSTSTDEEEDNPDAGLSVDELRAKYASIPEPSVVDDADEIVDNEAAQSTISRLTHVDSEAGASALDHGEQGVGNDLSQHMPELDEVDEVMLDDEDKSDTSGTPSEDEEQDTTDDNSDGGSLQSESEEESSAGASLLGFLNKKEIDDLKKDEDWPKKLQSDDEERPVRECSPAKPREDVKMETDEPETPLEFQSAAESLQTTPRETHPSRDQEDTTKNDVEQSISKSSEIRAHAPNGADLNNLLNYTHENSEPQIEISQLIRGQLRPYQHAGFEWLAGMYENSTNGILADEMGLGKTFQTIALLAHLATRYHVWGPHLIVVPTSVILNWEIEFKKFLPGFKVLPYYGSQDERKEKRKGWNNDDKWNVVITSYQLALSDQAVLKRRRWHYLVLDEAHNIKNHKSQRWQTLLSFRSEARLLLTGTPLQNNLAELWSLLFFLAPEQDEEGRTSFGDLSQFSKIFHRPVDQILENGRGSLDKEGMGIVSKLHQVLRPHLLRRLKADVEKQMPKKYEHVTVCRLSKRQRQLYDGYMSRAGTRDSFSSGNYMSIINCLMQLRKVCNHPDLFETRQIVTSFAMPKSAVAGYEMREQLVRRKLLQKANQSSLEMASLWHVNTSSFAAEQGQRLTAEPMFSSLLEDASSGHVHDTNDESLVSSLRGVATHLQQAQIEALKRRRSLTSQRNGLRPAYSEGLIQQIRLDTLPYIFTPASHPSRQGNDALLDRSSILSGLVQDLDRRSLALEPLVEKFCCTTPNVTAPGLARLTLTDIGVDLVESTTSRLKRDPFHEARVRLSIAFPDKSLIQYDCGKLQQLDKLLRNLQSGGHRAVIFTQMTKVLDILEQFMNLHGHRYLRLDGSTKIEQRQIITERFNTDTRILAFISSSRSGGLGINLTGADTVIFYDLDWNPAMDKQCQDRCHRIGQTRDVHIYRFVSEGTIEANILRKSNQKRMLDDVVIQEGDFTTEYFNRVSDDEGNEEADAAIDKVFGGGSTRMLQQAEDKEDQDAAKEAQKEELQADDADFGDKGADQGSGPETPRSATVLDKQSPTVDSGAGQADKKPPQLDRSQSNPEDIDSAAREQLFDHFASGPLPQDKPVFRDEDEEGNACPAGSDDYLIRLMGWELRHIIWVPPKSAKDKKKKKKGSEFGIIRR